MAKLFVVMGKSASGKDTIYRYLAADQSLSLREVVSYTTRPIRTGEQDGKAYHFVTEEVLQRLQEEGKVIEHRAYNTIHGVWNYFTVDDNQMDLQKSNYLLIGTLESYRQILKYYGSDIVKPIYVNVENGERLSRALEREKKEPHPKYEEMCRRFLADEKDFSEENLKNAGITRCFENEQLEDCMDEIRAYILEELQ